MSLMRKLILLLALSIKALNAMAQKVDTSDYQIYTVLIQHHISSDAKSINIINKTIQYGKPEPANMDTSDHRQVRLEWEMSFHAPFDSIAFPALTEYYLTKHKRKKLNYKFAFPLEVNYISSRSFNKLLDTLPGKRFERYYQKYPGSSGTFEFSNVFYSRDKTRAVLYFAVHREMGKGSVVILEKEKEIWQIKYESKIWYN
jgi:hypothetical protein